MVKVSLAQIPQSDFPEQNVERILRYMDLARGSDIVCFPETSLTGANKLAYLDVQKAAIARKARELGLWCVYGAYARSGDGTFNEAYVLDRDGVLRHTYRKKHLWFEGGVTPGDSNDVIETDFSKIGIVICWDIAFPEETRTLARNGAEIVFCPSYWFEKYGTARVIEILPQARAFENQVYFALCDAYTDETAARSRICSPLRVLAEADIREELISAKLDLGELRGLRETFDCWK